VGPLLGRVGLGYVCWDWMLHQLKEVDMLSAKMGLLMKRLDD
jgi:hypothetical protein